MQRGMTSAWIGAASMLVTGLASGVPWMNEAPAAPDWWLALARSGSGGMMSRSAVGGFAVDTASREEVRLFHLTVHRASEGVDSGWNGDVSLGNAGSTTEEFQDAVIRRVNYFRALSGVPAWVERSAEYGAKAQQAALMMSANDSLSHFPPPTWLHYTAEGAEAAAHSNLYLGEHGPGSVDGYMLDPGSNNALVGHRRWVLYPNTRHMGTGDIPGGGGVWPANALWVLDAQQSPTRPPTREAWVQWPPHGHVPYPLVPGRWSFSFPGADFGSATVSMTRDGVALPVTLEPLGNGAGDNTLAWIPSGMNPDAADHPRPVEDITYTVAVSDVRVGGQWRTFQTRVVVVDPARPGADTVDTRPIGPAQVEVGVNAAFTIPEVPKASGYRWSRARLTPSVGSWGGEDSGDGMVMGVSAGYDVRVQEAGAEGGWCYHLAHATPSVQSLTVGRTFLVGAASELRFSKMVGVATTGQVARAQVEVGGAWMDVWTEAGNGSGQLTTVSLEPVTVSLAQHAGRTVRVRFLYEARGPYFPQTMSGVGFYVDSIRVAGSDELGEAATAEVGSAAFGFTAPEAGAWLLQAGPVVFGDYFGGNGSGWKVEAVPRGSLPALALLAPVLGAGGTLVLEWTATGGVTGPFVVDRAGTVDASMTWQPVAVSEQVSLGNGRYRGVVSAGGGQGFFRVRVP